MDFSKEEIARLYGSKIFLIPEDRAAPNKTVISWKLKEKAVIAFAFRDTEYSNKALTSLLEDIVKSMEIPQEKVGFGKFSSQPQPRDLGDQPVPFAIVFGKPQPIPQSNPLKNSAGEVFFSCSLEELSTSRPFKTELWEYLKSIKNLL